MKRVLNITVVLLFILILEPVPVFAGEIKYTYNEPFYVSFDVNQTVALTKENPTVDLNTVSDYVRIETTTGSGAYLTNFSNFKGRYLELDGDIDIDDIGISGTSSLFGFVIKNNGSVTKLNLSKLNTDRLEIDNCSNLNEIIFSDITFRRPDLSSSLKIQDCDKLKSFTLLNTNLNDLNLIGLWLDNLYIEDNTLLQSVTATHNVLRLVNTGNTKLTKDLTAVNEVLDNSVDNSYEATNGKVSRVEDNNVVKVKTEPISYYDKSRGGLCRIN